MKCPVDDTELAMSERQGIEVDYCPKCRGVWLDRGELDKIIKRSAAEEPRATFTRQTRMVNNQDTGTMTANMVLNVPTKRNRCSASFSIFDCPQHLVMFLRIQALEFLWGFGSSARAAGRDALLPYRLQSAPNFSTLLI